MKRINLGSGHAHQARAFMYAVRTIADKQRTTFRVDRKRFISHGMLLADGVGMGKTYEALATAVTWLQRKSMGRSRWKPRVLVLVPPQLVRKWRDEVCLPDRWPAYLRRIEHQTKIFECFSQPVAIKRSWNLDELLDKKTGRRLSGGFYIVNWGQLSRDGAHKWETRRRNLIKRTPWDVVIIDEAHLLPGRRFEDILETVQHRGTRVLLLTATPFQIETRDIKYLLENLFLPKHWDAYRAAEGVYNAGCFKDYRKGLRAAMEESDGERRRSAFARARLTKHETENLLRRLVIRNPSPQGREFHLAARDGTTRKIQAPTGRTEPELRAELTRGHLVELSPPETYYYLAGLERLLPIDRAEQVGAGHFDGFRHLLSSYANFRRSKAGRTRIPGHSIERYLAIDEARHPRVAACVNLVERIVRAELEAVLAGRKDHIGKVVVFVRFIDGTLPILKRLLQRRLEDVLAEHRRRGAHPYAELRRSSESLLERLEADLKGGRRDSAFAEAAGTLARLRRTLGKATAKPRGQEGYARAVARLVLSRGPALQEEQALLRRRLREAARDVGLLRSDNLAGIEAISLQERLVDVLESLCDRYKARDLVLTLSGELDDDEKAANRTAFNSPGAPLVLIASPVGQVGIDLQAYAEHVVHYELEWNPARMEQREGRVDRLGRRGDGKVKVYYLVCRDTYDERMFLQTSRRQLWHRLLIGRHRGIEKEDEATEMISDLGGRTFERLALDLRPRS